MKRLLKSLYFTFLLFGALFGNVNVLFALTWNMPPELFNSPPPPNSFSARLAVDPTGNAFTAWLYPDFNGVQVSRFSNETQVYGPTVTIYTDPAPVNGISGIGIATDASQTALLVWGEADAGQVQTALYDGTSWGAPVVLAPVPPGTFIFPSVAMNGLGNGVAVWGDASGATPPGDIVASFFDGGTQTWGPLQVLTPGGTGGFFPNVAYSASGIAVAVWLDGLANVVAASYNGVVWSVPVMISLLPATSSTSVELGISSEGNAVATWMDAATSSVISSSFIAGVWSPPQDLSSPETGIFYFDFAMSSGGSAIVGWINGSSVGTYRIYNSGVWSPAVPNAFPDASAIGVGMDTIGNALIAVDFNSPSEVRSYTLPQGGSLSNSDFVATGSELFPGFVGYADNGRGFISGTLENDTDSFVSATYSLLFPSGTINGKVCKNRFATAAERVKIITWTASSPSAVSYNIRRNGKLIANVPASGPLEYKDRHRCKKTDVYTVASVSASGAESDVLTVSIK